MAVVIPTSCGGGDDEAPKSQFVNAKAPTITVLVPEANVFGGAKVEQADSSLLIGGEKVAEWKAGSGKVKSLELSFNGTPISMGTVISEKGYLSLKITNEADRSANSTITLTDEVIIGLSALQELLQVDQEANLIENLTFVKGVELTKTEIEFEGQRTEIADPQHFTPEYPGSCTLFFSVKKNGTIGEVKAENLTIKPLENYTEVIIVEADMIAKFYPWYNNLQQSTKDFIYPHLLSSYAACNWSKLDNRVHIIMGETPDTDDVENI